MSLGGRIGALKICLLMPQAPRSFASRWDPFGSDTLYSSTTGGAAQDGIASQARDLPFPVPGFEEAGMAHWPRTVSGNLVTLFAGGFALYIVGALIFVLFKAGPIIWSSALVIVTMVGILIVRNRLAWAASDRATVNAPSFFGTVLPSHDPVPEPVL